VPQLTRALSHLRPGTDGDGALTVYAWDDESTRTPAPFAPWLAGRGAFRAQVGEAFVVAEDGRVETLDLALGEAFFRVDSIRRIPWFDTAVPLQTILQRWTAARGVPFVHAGAVGHAEGCVLIVGRSGAGKSTTALASLGSGLGYIADDFCLVRAADATVFSIYGSAKATDDTLARLPHLAPLTSRLGPPGEKAVAFLHEHVPEQLVLQAPLRAIVVPRIADRRAPALVAAGRATALAQMTPSSLACDPRDRATAFRGLAAVAAAVPCFTLELGSDVAAIPRLLERLLG
jgi:hypothetical protein